MTAGQDGFRNPSSKQGRGIVCHWIPRNASGLRSPDHTISSCSSKHRPQREAVTAFTLKGL